MLFFILTLIAFPEQTQAQDVTAELKKITDSVKSALDDYCTQARMINGTVSTYDLDGTEKKLRHKTVIKSDKTRYITAQYNAEDRFVSAEVYRDFGDMRQALLIETYRVSNEPTLRFEYYAKKGEKNDHFVTIDDIRTFAYDTPSAFALRPVSHLKLSFLDLLDYPAFKVTSIRHHQSGNNKLVKLNFQVDQELNAKQPPDLQLANLQEGWFELRPDQFWTVNSAEYMIPANRRRPGRRWKTEVTYDAAKNAIPLPKEIKMTTVDQKEKTDLKPISQLYEFDLKLITVPLPDDQVTLTQFKLKERTPDEWLKDQEILRKQETESAPAPAGGFPIASSGPAVSPWVWLGGGLASILLLIVASFQFTAKKTTPPPAPLK